MTRSYRPRARTRPEPRRAPGRSRPRRRGGGCPRGRCRRHHPPGPALGRLRGRAAPARHVHPAGLPSDRPLRQRRLVRQPADRADRGDDGRQDEPQPEHHVSAPAGPGERRLHRGAVGAPPEAQPPHVHAHGQRARGVCAPEGGAGALPRSDRAQHHADQGRDLRGGREAARYSIGFLRP